MQRCCGRETNIPSIGAKVKQEPTFAGRTELARYITVHERRGTRHAAASAFLLSDTDISSGSNPHLSVNSLEVESLAHIGDYLRKVFQADTGEVALCTHKVQRYVNEGRTCGLTISHGADEGWTFVEGRASSAAFKHRPVQGLRARGRPGSQSHCGVEFLRAMTDLQRRQFARRMARSPRFHVV